MKGLWGVLNIRTIHMLHFLITLLKMTIQPTPFELPLLCNVKTSVTNMIVNSSNKQINNIGSVANVDFVYSSINCT